MNSNVSISSCSADLDEPAPSFALATLCDGYQTEFVNGCNGFGNDFIMQLSEAPQRSDLTEDIYQEELDYQNFPAEKAIEEYGTVCTYEKDDILDLNLDLSTPDVLNSNPVMSEFSTVVVATESANAPHTTGELANGCCSNLEMYFPEPADNHDDSESVGNYALSHTLLLCTYCGRSVISSEDMSSHFKKFHSHLPVLYFQMPKWGKLFSCNKCSSLSENMQDHLRHLCTAHEIVCLCGHCEIEQKSMKELEIHNRRFHPNLPLKVLKASVENKNDRPQGSSSKIKPRENGRIKKSQPKKKKHSYYNDPSFAPVQNGKIKKMSKKSTRKSSSSSSPHATRIPNGLDDSHRANSPDRTDGEVYVWLKNGEQNHCVPFSELGKFLNLTPVVILKDVLHIDSPKTNSAGEVG